MAGNTFGHLFSVTSFGESHGPAIGGVIDGCPPGLAIDEAMLQRELDRALAASSSALAAATAPGPVARHQDASEGSGHGRADGGAVSKGGGAGYVRGGGGSDGDALSRRPLSIGELSPSSAIEDDRDVGTRSTPLRVGGDGAGPRSSGTRGADAGGGSGRRPLSVGDFSPSSDSDDDGTDPGATPRRASARSLVLDEPTPPFRSLLRAATSQRGGA